MDPVVGQLGLGTKHRVRLGRDVARLQLTHQRMVPQLQRDLQEYLEHGGHQRMVPQLQRDLQEMR